MPEEEPKGDSRSTAEFVKAEFGIDIDAERQKIEAECEKHLARIQEIAQVFGIDPEFMEGSRDEEIAGLVEENLELDRRPQGNFIFRFEGKELWIEPSLTVSLMSSPRYAVEAIKKVGKIDNYVSPDNHPNYLSDLSVDKGFGGLGLLTLTPEEQMVCQPYLKDKTPQGGIHFRDTNRVLSPKSALIVLLGKAQSDEKLKAAVEGINMQKAFDSPSPFQYIYNNLLDRTEAIEKFISSYNESKEIPESLDKALSEQGRLFCIIGLAVLVRLLFLIREASKGKIDGVELTSEEDGKKKFSVKTTYHLTDELGRQAIESEMSWLSKFMKQ